MVIAHVDMNTFFVSVERLKDPSLNDKPVVVGGQPGTRSVVAAASYEAREFGIHSAMPIDQAVRLCDSLIIIPPHGSDYQDAHHQVKAILSSFTPALEMASVDEGYLDLTGTEKLFGPAATAGKNIRQRLMDETGLPCSIGIASNKLVAKVASGLAKPGRSTATLRTGVSTQEKNRHAEALEARRFEPNTYLISPGVIVVPAGREASFLAPLPVAQLPGCGKMTLPRLKALGIQTIGELASFDEEELARHFGDAGRVLWRRANGLGSQLVSPERERKSISKETTFAEDVDDQETIKSTLHQLTHEVGTSLRRHGFQSRTITLKLRYPGFETHTHAHTLDEPTAHTATLFKTVLALFQRHHTRQPVRLIGMAVSKLSRGRTQEDLFDQPDDKRMARIEETFDAIRDRFGKTSLTTADSLNPSKDSSFDK